MNQFANNKSSIQPTQTVAKRKRKTYKKCNECTRIRKTYASHQICRICYVAKKIFKPSGNKVIDDFIKYTQTNYVQPEGKMDFVPYDKFKNVEFIAEGGFSKIYRATWIDGPWHKGQQHSRNGKTAIALKELNNSKNINSKELNEV